MDLGRRAETAPGAFNELFHAVEDGLLLSYRDYPAVGEPRDGGAAARLPVICLHALTRNAKDFEEVAPAIAAPKDGRLGRRVIVPSMRGRGRSSWDPKPERYNPAVYAADVRGLLDSLAIPRAVFVGTSLGGIVSMVLAATDSGRVAACVLNDVGAELAPEGLARIRGYVGRGAPVRDWAEAAERTREVNGVAFPSERGAGFWIAFAKRTRRETPEGLVPDYDPAIGQLVRGSEAPPDALWPLFEALKTTPTLLIRGALSDLLSPQTVAAMQARKPDLELVEIPGVGHAPLLTEQAAAAALAAFLSRVG